MTSLALPVSASPAPASMPYSEYLRKPKQFVRIRPHQPPQIGQSMVGTVLEHPFHPPMTEVCTTAVLSIEGNRVETRSSVYELVR